MDWRPMLVGTAASVSFMALALAGAFAMVGLSPAAHPLQPPARPLPPVPAPVRRAAPEVAPARDLAPATDLAPARDLAPATDAVPQPATPGAPATGAAPWAARAALPEPAPPAPARAGAEHPRRAARPARLAALDHAHPPELRARPAVLAAPRARPEREGAGRESTGREGAGREGAADGVVTSARLRRFRSALHLTREQEPLWRPVEQALRRIGDEQAAMIRAGQDPREAFGFVAAMRIYAVARPFLDALREDQRGQVRAHARGMGFGSVAAQI